MFRRNLVGLRFNRLVVISHSHCTEKGINYWNCMCDCGKTTKVSTAKLNNGHTNSCGCLQKEKASKSRKTHGKSKEKLYIRWNGIKARCYNKNNSAYRRYGGRGITICEEWLDYEKFRKWAYENGYSEELELDRIDNNKNYEPSNCRWVTNATNSRNKSSNVIMETGENLIDFCKRIAKENNLTYSCVVNRYYRLKSKRIETSETNIINYKNIC